MFKKFLSLFKRNEKHKPQKNKQKKFFDICEEEFDIAYVNYIH
ncbi:hypothetical protein J6TS2_05560 [Heyndrickxia sporothermodurans]|nr:hypothetical protein J6TS2_05560 [Heyndrickxia sporothermodurans]